MGYVPAVAHFGKEVWVDCYTYPPGEHILKRKKYRCNIKGGPVAQKKYARDLVESINQKLRRGWNPWSVEVAPRGQVTLRQAVRAYLASVLPTLSNRSPIAYNNMAQRIVAWADREGIADQPIENFNKTMAYRFLDYIREERKVGNNTWNNYHLAITIMFNWMVEREYRRTNPFQRIKKMKKTEKIRTLILPHERQQCLEWFAKNDPTMVLPCLFTFHTLLRPRSELLRIRVRDIDMVGGIIAIDGIKTKSKRIRRPAIPHAMVSYLTESGVLSLPPEYYVVGKGLLPGNEPCAYNTLGLRWNKMRKALGWKADKQMYSMRDSGIVQLIADGVDLHAVMIQAGHKDIATTNKYVQHFFPGGVTQIQQKASPFIGVMPS